MILARMLSISFDPMIAAWAVTEPYKTHSTLPAGHCRASKDPTMTFGRLPKNQARSFGSLGSATANPYDSIIPSFTLYITH